ncbi:hypothetical protein ACU4GD_05970 [Cupriavidus basilensis]
MPLTHWVGNPRGRFVRSRRKGWLIWVDDYSTRCPYIHSILRVWSDTIEVVPHRSCAYRIAFDKLRVGSAMEQRFRKRFLLLGAGHLSDQRSRFFLRILSCHIRSNAP